MDTVQDQCTTYAWCISGADHPAIHGHLSATLSVAAVSDPDLFGATPDEPIQVPAVHLAASEDDGVLSVDLTVVEPARVFEAGGELRQVPSVTGHVALSYAEAVRLRDRLDALLEATATRPDEMSQTAHTSHTGGAR